MSAPSPAAGVRTTAEVRGRIATLDGQPERDPLGQIRARLLNALPFDEAMDGVDLDPAVDQDALRARWGTVPPEEQAEQVLAAILARFGGHLDALTWLLGDAAHDVYLQATAHGPRAALGAFSGITEKR